MNRQVTVGLAALISAAVVAGCGAAPGQKLQTGSKAVLEYSLEADGKEIISHTSPERAHVEVGKHLFPGEFEKQLVGMAVGSSKIISLQPSQAFGQLDPKLLKRAPKSTFPAGMELKEGALIGGAKDANGRIIPMRIAKVLEDEVVIDQNHPLAGKQLVYRVKVIRIES